MNPYPPYLFGILAKILKAFPPKTFSRYFSGTIVQRIMAARFLESGLLEAGNPGEMDVRIYYDHCVKPWKKRQIE